MNVRVAWIGKFRPGSEYIKWMREIIGDYFKFDYLGEMYDDDVRRLIDYDYVFGNTNIYGVVEFVNLRRRYGKPRFFKIMSVKYAHRKYKPVGFYEVFDIGYVVNPVVGNKVLVVSRHKDITIPKERIVKVIRGFIGSADTVFWLMKKYGADDVFWINDVAVYDDLINMFGVKPLRTARDKNGDLKLLRISRVRGKKWVFR